MMPWGTEIILKLFLVNLQVGFADLNLTIFDDDKGKIF